MIVGCTALHVFKESFSGEIACLAVHPDYQNAARGSRLLEHIYTQAKHFGLKTVYVLSTQTMHWFIERGFQAADINTLPQALKHHYSPQRNSKAFYKNIE
jgi:amino-acid N-acetyltransferase